jgi:cytoskeleton protein RodZ
MRDDSVEIAQEAAAPAEDAGPVETEPPAPHMAREKPDGEADPAGEAGWYLEHERLARGVSLEEAGEATGIHPYHLDAIELGDMTRMPERMEALEMIGAYAQYLGFDPEPLVDHYAAILPPPPLMAEPRHPANPGPLSSAKVLAFGKLPQFPKFRLNGVPGGAGGLVAAIAGAVLLFAGASYLLMPKGDAPAASGEVAAFEPPAADPMPTASTGPDAADVTVGDEPMPDETAQAGKPLQLGEDDLAGTGLDGISALIEQNVPGAGNDAKSLEGLAAAASGVAITNEGRQFGADNGESRLTLKAKAPVWVRIEDSHGNVVMTQMLMKGDTYRVPNREGLVVIARDGGLISYLIDGKEKGILGTPGEILVGRSLDLKSFEG